MRFIQDDVRRLMPGAWAYARVESAADAVRSGLPDIVGSNGARLVLRGSPDPIGPPSGAARIAARWHVGRSSGEADLLIFPLSDNLCEVHLTLEPSGSFNWRGTRLTRLAQELARALAAAVAPPETLRRRPAFEEGGVGGRWTFRPASRSSASF
jgi:hypothetical protein